jgi:hypothetical protein
MIETGNQGQKENYLYTSADKGIVFAGSNTFCDKLYKPLCEYIRTERKTAGLNDDQQLYSIYDDRPSGENYTKLNPYIDCNCENSKIIVRKQNYGIDPNYDFETAAQTNDIRCSGPANQTYKSSNKKVEKMCVQVMNAQNLTVEEKAGLNLSQSCNIDSKNSTAGPNLARENIYVKPVEFPEATKSIKSTESTESTKFQVQQKLSSFIESVNNLSESKLGNKSFIWIISGVVLFLFIILIIILLSD